MKRYPTPALRAPALIVALLLLPATGCHLRKFYVPRVGVDARSGATVVAKSRSGDASLASVFINVYGFDHGCPAKPEADDNAYRGTIFLSKSGDAQFVLEAETPVMLLLRYGDENRGCNTAVAFRPAAGAQYQFTYSTPPPGAVKCGILMTAAVPTATGSVRYAEVEPIARSQYRRRWGGDELTDSICAAASFPTARVKETLPVAPPPTAPDAP